MMAAFITYLFIISFLFVSSDFCSFVHSLWPFLGLFENLNMPSQFFGRSIGYISIILEIAPHITTHVSFSEMIRVGILPLD